MILKDLIHYNCNRFKVRLHHIEKLCDMGVAFCKIDDIAIFNMNLKRCHLYYLRKTFLFHAEKKKINVFYISALVLVMPLDMLPLLDSVANLIGQS